MTNPHTPAPRPCTLWGSTFDLSESRRIPLISFREGFPKKTDNFGKSLRIKIVSRFDNKSALAESDWERDMEAIGRHQIEAITAIHQALNPPLCMKHALEIGYEFSIAGEFIVSNSRSKLFVQYDDESNVFLDTYCNEYELEDFNWFKPDIYTDAEAVVNAWEGE